MSTLQIIESAMRGAKAARRTSCEGLTFAKTGVALSAEAVAKLQALADWLELDRLCEGDRYRTVQYGHYGDVCTIRDWKDSSKYVTYVSAAGALVQMYQPLRLSDADRIAHDMWRASPRTVSKRIASILGISDDNVIPLWTYFLREGSYRSTIISQIRALNE